MTEQADDFYTEFYRLLEEVVRRSQSDKPAREYASSISGKVGLLLDRIEKELDKAYQSGVEAERKRHNWWGNFDNYHAHCINGEHFIGKNPGYGCDECKRVFGTGYTDSLTNQGETK